MPSKMSEEGEVGEKIEGDIMEAGSSGAPPRRRRMNRKNLIGIGFIAVVMAAGAWTFFSDSGGLALGGDAYQAVFLDNNQVYFGKLTNTASAYPVLKDIFYLRVTQPLQPPEGGDAQPNINLVKLGTELHGPSDEMRINREHILFIEDLKADSEVTKAINNFKAAQ